MIIAMQEKKEKLHEILVDERRKLLEVNFYFIDQFVKYHERVQIIHVTKYH